MANTKPAVGTAVPSAVNDDWLTIDTTAAERGSGPAEYGYPSPGPGAPVVPTGTNPLPLDSPELAPDSDGYQVDPEGDGAWPVLPDVYNGWQAPIQRQQGPSQGTFESTAPSSGSFGYSGAWGRVEPLQTWDYVYQSTDNEGWRQNITNDRSSSRRTWGQTNPGNVPTWYAYGERPVRSKMAITSAPFTSDSGQFGVIGSSDGSLPSWAMTGGQGNTSYETPGPPSTSSVAQQMQSSADPAASWA
jgi:hypothetical protein